MRIIDWSADVRPADLIGSQLTSLAPFEAAFERVGQLVADLRAAGHSITHVDLGGGLGVPYRAGDNILPPSPADYGAMVARVTRDWDVTLMFEPGRVIAGNSGVLLTEILWRSEEHTSELQSLMRISYAVFCLKKKKM